MAKSIPARPGGESKREVAIGARWEQSQTNPEQIPHPEKETKGDVGAVLGLDATVRC